MKQIRCPYCKGLFTLSKEMLRKGNEQSISLEFKCPLCDKILKGKISKGAEKKESKKEQKQKISLLVLEGDFCFRQEIYLSIGLFSVGRKNKDTEQDCAIESADPSLGRHHCVIKVTEKRDKILAQIKDDDSMVGTFVNGNILGKNEFYNLKDGDVITLGATSIIFSYLS